ncbi:hypothetical protein Tco_0604120 [Tanacetum coccineum]
MHTKVLKKAKEVETISEAVLTEAEQLKIITKRSRKETHISHVSWSGADEGTGVSPGVPDAPDYDSDDDISWKSSEDDQDDDEAQTESEDDDDEDSDNEVEGMDVDGEKSDEDATYVQATQKIEDTHVTLTPVNPDGQQQSSSVSSVFISNMLNPNQDIGVDAIFGHNAQATSLIDILVTAIAEPSFFAPTNHPPTPTPLFIQLQQPPILTPRLLLQAPHFKIFLTLLRCLVLITD